eukprot:2210-Heterococcus_DN1.PRE.4
MMHSLLCVHVLEMMCQNAVGLCSYDCPAAPAYLQDAIVNSLVGALMIIMGLYDVVQHPELQRIQYICCHHSGGTRIRKQRQHKNRVDTLRLALRAFTSMSPHYWQYAKMHYLAHSIAIRKTTNC